MKNKILYEKKLYEIDEEEYDHYHLKGNNVVIRKNEVIKIPFIKILYSKYSEKKVRKEIYESIMHFYEVVERLIKWNKKNH